MVCSWLHKSVLSGGILLAGLAVGCSGMGAQPPDAGAEGSGAPPFAKVQEVEIPAGTALYVRLQEPISSATAQTGQSFSATLDDPLMIAGQTAVPKGAEISGRVVAARQSGHLHDAGYLRITLASMTLNGKTIPIQTSSLFVQGGSFRNRNLAYIGGGTGGGALLGALIGGGKGAAIGSTVGAAGGATAAYATGKKEVGFNTEQRLGFRLTQSATVQPLVVK